MDYTLPIIVLALIAVVHGDIVNFKPCPGASENLNCEITQLRITPCPESANNKPCVMKRGKNADIEFDFTGKADVTNLTTRAYWSTGAGDLPLLGMDTVGCKHAQCPTVGGSETFKYDLEMSKKFPARGYDVKWRLWKEDEMECCLIFKIKLEK